MSPPWQTKKLKHTNTHWMEKAAVVQQGLAGWLALPPFLFSGPACVCFGIRVPSQHRQREREQRRGANCLVLRRISGFSPSLLLPLVIWSGHAASTYVHTICCCHYCYCLLPACLLPAQKFQFCEWAKDGADGLGSVHAFLHRRHQPTLNSVLSRLRIKHHQRTEQVLECTYIPIWYVLVTGTQSKYIRMKAQVHLNFPMLGFWLGAHVS